MAKAILLSIRPNWVKLILNKKKIYEIRRQFPKDYVGWVYIYCTQDNKNKLVFNHLFNGYYISQKETSALNGKVVARFWCDKVLELRPFQYYGHTWWIEKTTTNYRQFLQILQRSLLTEKQIKDYAKRKRELFSVVVDKLEIFDKPKELSEFYYFKPRKMNTFRDLENGTEVVSSLTKAPMNYCYIDIDNSTTI